MKIIAGPASCGFLAAALVVVSSMGCGSSGGIGGSGNSGGTGAVPGTGGVGSGGAAAGSGGAGSGGASSSGGSAGPGGASSSASGGTQGGGGVSVGAGGSAGAIGPIVTAGTGVGGTAVKGGNGGSALGGKGGAALGGEGGAALGGMTAVGGSFAGHSGAGGAAVAGHGGAGGSGTAGTGGTVSTATLLVELGNAFCAAARTCCAAKSLPITLGDCEAQFASRLWGLPYYNKGTETIDNIALAACIAGYKQTAKTCAFQPLEVACKGVFVGTKAEGAACGKGGVPMTSGVGECKITGRVTQCLWTGDSNVATTAGVCQSAVHGKKGDPCATSCGKNERCTWDLLTSPGYPTAVCLEEDGLYCSSAVTPSVCATIVPTGGNCEAESLACASTDYCDHTTTPAKCRKAATLGQACPSSGPYCANGMSLFCGTTNKCEDLGFAYEMTCGGTPPFPL
ncbi:MAG: hypothetical protein ABJA82_14010 [Myxococcales bacterium]